ncbi:hypothetical protein AADW59_00115 [Candidatus Hodgkinia cicadicola]
MFSTLSSLVVFADIVLVNVAFASLFLLAHTVWLLDIFKSSVGIDTPIAQGNDHTGQRVLRSIFPSNFWRLLSLISIMFSTVVLFVCFVCFLDVILFSAFVSLIFATLCVMSFSDMLLFSTSDHIIDFFPKARLFDLMSSSNLVNTFICELARMLVLGL